MDARCSETLKNAKLSATLAEIVRAHELDQGRCSKEKGALVKQVGITLPASAAAHRSLLINHIKEGKIARNEQCTAAIKYVKARANESDLDIAEFDRSCGVGVVVSDSDIEAAVAEVMHDQRGAIEEERYHFNLMKLVQPIKQIGDMAWADIDKVKAQLDAQAAQLLGPKTAEDEKPRVKPKKPKGPPKSAPKARFELERLFFTSKACVHVRRRLLWQRMCNAVRMPEGIAQKLVCVCDWS